jgi:tetratricopeptide (TPR) repeat protein
VLLSGEPGIGKSRLTAALLDRVEAEHPICLRYFCLPHHQGSSLQPVVGQLAHAAGFSRDDTAEQKRAKIETLLARGSANVAATTALLSDLLGLGVRAEGTAPVDPQRKRVQVLGALLDQLADLTRRGPVLMLFEDAHWSDPTSLELFTLTIERMQTLPILLIITHRPDYQPSWAGQPHVTTMSLSRLGRRERIMLVDHVSGGKALPQALLDQIVERTDGVPLFVEELTKAVLESEIDQPTQQLAIPATLQDSLMARVDRLGSAREVLQIGAAIGREFSYELLAAVAGLPDAVLRDALVRLTEAELLYLRGTPPDAVYAFKHALVQDTSYSTMLRARRQQLHGTIAQVLEKRFPDLVSSTPEIMAQQFEGAGHAEQAIRYWRQAGDQDLRRFALKEAISHYTGAMRVIMGMPESVVRSEQELAASLALALATQIALGPGAVESAKHYRRAEALCQELPGHVRETFLATWGLWLHHSMREESAEAIPRSDRMIQIAQDLADPDMLMEAYHAKAATLQRLGDYPGIAEAAEQVIQLYDRERHREHAYLFGGHDARVCVRSFYAISLWARGFFDQAHKMGHASIEDARQLGHAFSICHALHQTAITFALLDDVDTCQAIVDELIPLAERNKFPWPLANGRFLRGWVLARRGNDAEGISLMLEAAENPSAGVRRPVLLTLCAEALVRAGRYPEGERVLDRANKIERKARVHTLNVEAIRLRGLIAFYTSPGDRGQAESHFLEAIKMAREQSCCALELRASMDLARVLRDQGRPKEGHDLVAQIYAAFTEGFDWPDLKAAKALLAELSGGTK